MDIAILGLKVDSKGVTTADKNLDSMSKSAGKAESSFEDLAMSVGKVVAAAASLGVVASQALEIDSASKKLAASLGVTGAAAEEFADIGKTIYTGAWGDSLDEVNTAVASTAKTFAAIGINSKSAIQSATQDAMTLGSIYGDTEKQIQSISILMKEFGVSQKEASDLIAGGFQRGLDSSGDFLDSILEYSNQFSQGEASAGQFFSVLETGLAGGVLGTDKAADMFKEFQDRVLNGSKATSEGLAKIGINSDEMVRKISTGQVTVADAFGNVVDKLRSTTDAATKAQVGADLLGDQFMDLGANAALSIDIAKTSIDDLSGAMDAANQVNQTASIAMTEAWRTFIVAVSDSAPVQGAMRVIADSLQAVTFVINEMPGIATYSFAAIAKAGMALPAIFVVIGDNIRAAIVNAFAFIGEKVGRLVDSVGYLMKEFGIEGGAALTSVGQSFSQLSKQARTTDVDFKALYGEMTADIDGWRDSMILGGKNADILGDNIKGLNIPVRKVAKESEIAANSVKMLGTSAQTSGAKASKAAKEFDNLLSQISKLDADLNFSEATAGMTQLEVQARKYSDLLQKTGKYSEDEVKNLEKSRLARLENVEAVKKQADEQRRAQEYSKDAIDDLQYEIKLLGMASDEDRDRYDFLRGITPEMQEQAAILYDQVQAIEEQNRKLEDQRKLWGSLGNIAGDFLGELARGGDFKAAASSLGDSLSGFAMENSADMQGMSAVSMLKDLDLGSFGDSLGGIAESVDGLAGAVGGMGNLVGGLGAGISLLSGDVQGGLSGIGGMVGQALIPIPGIGGMIGSALGGLLGGALSGGETRSGGAYSFGAEGFEKIQGPSGGDVGLDKVQQAMATMVQGTNAMLQGLGATARVEGITGALETSENSRGGVWAGGTLTGGATFGEQFSGENVFESQTSRDLNPEQAMQAFILDLQQASVQALQAADVPAWVSSLLDGVDVESLSMEQVQSVLGTIDAIGNAVSIMEQFGVAADSVTESMIAGAGGAESLAASTSAYYSDFYSETEIAQMQAAKLTATLASAFDEIGIALPGTNDEFRALVDALDLTTAAGQKLFGQLMALSPAFAKLTDLQGDEVKETEEAAKGLGNSYQHIDTMMMRGTASAQRFGEATAKAADTMKNEAQSLLDFVQGLALGDVSTLKESEKLSLAQDKYIQTLARAQGGDVQALKDIKGATSAYRDIAKTFYGDSEKFAEIERNTRRDLTDLANDSLAPQAPSIAAEKREQDLKKMLDEQQATNRLLEEQLRRNDANTDAQIGATDRTGNKITVASQGNNLANAYA